MNRGYVKIWRKIEDSGIIGNADLCQMLMYLMLKATHKDRKITVGTKVITLKPGQYFTGRKQLSSALGSTEQRIRTCLKSLEKCEIINQQSTSYGSIISLINWDKYQCDQPAINQQTNQQSTNNQPTTNQQPTTKQALKHLSTEDIQEPPISPTGEVRAKTRRQKTSAPENYTPEFEQLWLVSPARNGMKKGKRVAFEKFWHLTQISRLVTAEYLCERMKKLAPQYGAYARDLVTWLNQCGWEDQEHLPMAAAPYDWRKDCATN